MAIARQLKPKRRPSLGRQGFVFTSVATIVVLVLIAFALAESNTLDRTLVQTARVHTMDKYLENLEVDLPRAAYISAFRSMIAMEEHTSATGGFLNDTDAAFQESFTNGTINAAPYAIMDQSTFTEFTTRFAAIAQRQGLIVNLTVLNLTLSQSDPWEITVSVDIAVNLSDSAGTARFERSIAVVTDVPIIDIKDPLYSVYTQGRAPHPVRQSSASRPYITASNDTSNLTEMVNQTTYIAVPGAPSFLQRFQGNTTGSPYGIQSLINTPELRAQDIVTNNCYSLVDYKFFTNQTETTYRVVNMDFQNFWLGASDLATYDATGKTVGTLCP